MFLEPPEEHVSPLQRLAKTFELIPPQTRSHYKGEIRPQNKLRSLRLRTVLIACVPMGSGSSYYHESKDANSHAQALLPSEGFCEVTVPSVSI